MSIHCVFQCLDDDDNAKALCASLAEEATIGRLEIPHRSPSPWEIEIAAILNQISSGGVGGFLLDYRLDEKSPPVSAGEAASLPVSYTADSLVQELRRRSVEGHENSFPIVLWSNAGRLGEFRDLDPDFRFHYDFIIDKETIGTNTAHKADVLISLSEGYKMLRAKSGKLAAISPFLNPPHEDIATSVDAFFKNQYPSRGYAYQTALFILHELIVPQGPLVGVDMLSALLGVELDVLKKSDTFSDELKKYLYTGVFSGAFVRYWKEPLLTFLDSISEGKRGWIRMDAPSRSIALSAYFKIQGIVDIKPITERYSSAYDTICAVTKQPLNRMNGFALFDDRPRIWKDTRFISAQELRRTYKAAGLHNRLDDGEERRFLAMYAS